MKKTIPPKRHKIWQWMWILWLIVICLLSLMPIGSSMNQSFFDWPHMDKVVHGIMYAVLSLTMLKFLQFYAVSHPVIYTLIFCVCFGISMEILQSTKIINRDFECSDIIANIIGTFTGIAITKYLKI